MSSEIYYDRAFIKLGDGYIPMVCQGSSNCFDFSYRTGREIPEKHWQVLNCRNRRKVLFSADEIREIAVYYGEIAKDGIINRTRYRAFTGEEFRKWILGGIRGAHTVEEYRDYNNDLYLQAYRAWDDFDMIPIRTSEELLLLLSEHQGNMELNMRFLDERNVRRPKRGGGCA